MQTSNIISRLVNAGVPSNIIDITLQYAQFRNVKSQKLLISHGEKNQDVFIILRGGFVYQYLNDKTGELRTVNFFLESFQPFISTESFFKGIPSRCQLKAIQNSDVLVINKEHIDNAIQDDVHLKDFYIQHLIDSLLAENEFKIQIISNTPEELYQSLILHHPEIIQNVPSKYIAEFMGITPVWLSKLRNKR